MNSFSGNAEISQATGESEIEVLFSHALADCNDCLNRGDFPGALQLLDHALDLSPGNPEILTHRGRLLLFLKEFDRAQADFDKALPADSRCAAIHSGLARCHFEKRAYDLARTCATHARTIDPANQEAGEVLSALEKATRITERPVPAIAPAPAPGGGHQGKLFAKTGPQFSEALLAGLRGRRLAIIGNATITREFGSLIDTYDAVIRLNNFRLAGFESLVGTRTDFRCTTGFKDIEHRNEHPEFSPFCADALESTHLAAFNRANARPVLSAQLDVHPFIPETPNPSTGLALVQLCAQLGLSADLFGFDGFKSPHYWQSDANFRTTHSRQELAMILRRPNVILFGETYPYAALYDFCHANHRDYDDNAGLKLVHQLGRAFREKTILEFGAGNGELSRYLEAQANRVTAIEVSGHAFARIQCTRKIQGDALTLALLREHFDVFASVDVLAHLTENDIRLVLREAGRLADSLFLSVSTRPSGLLGPNGENLHLTVRPAQWWVEEVGRYFDVRLSNGYGTGQIVLEGRVKSHRPAAEFFAAAMNSHPENPKTQTTAPCPVCHQPAAFALVKMDHIYFRCGGCEAVFTPAIDTSILRTENNGFSLRHDPGMDFERLRRLEAGLNRSVTDLVDFGCGNGEFVKLMCEKGVRCIGVDKGTEKQLADLPDAAIDGIMMCEVIEHLYQPGEIFQQFQRVLRPGGAVYIESSFVDGQDLSDWVYLDPAIGHCTLHSENSMKLLAETHGFSLKKLNLNVYLMKKAAPEVEFQFFPPEILPAPPEKPAADWFVATGQRLARELSAIGPFYLHLGGAGDALLLLATFLDQHPNAQIVSFPNSIPAARSFFEAFPSLKRVRFLPKNGNPQIHLLIRMLMRHTPNCHGMGVTPEIDYFKEWNETLDIFKKFNVSKRPEWARRFRTNPRPKQIALAPQGSLQGMCGSKRNLIDPQIWPELLRFILESGFIPAVIGTPDESKLYPLIEGCENRRSYSFRAQMEHIANSDALIGADSWAKTFSALAEIPTLVFEPLKGLDWTGLKDPSDFVFLDPWDSITIVKNLQECRAAFARILKLSPPPSPAGTAPAFNLSWEGSFLDHGSLSHVNRELTGALDAHSCFQLERVGHGTARAPGFEQLAQRLSSRPSGKATVTVRHAWPPNWQRPARGKLVVIQPWEFGSLPADWVRQSESVDEFWVPSEYVRQVYVESGIPAKKVFVVPNGIDPLKFNPRAAPMKLATPKRFKFLFVGGTIGRKGPDVLLQAYLKNFTAADDVCLVIKDFGGKSVYAGQTFESQIRAAQTLPTAPEILYLNDELPPESLPGLYTGCDCLVLPYRGEGFGLPVLEAMACGLPVIVSAGGATDDFVRDEFTWRIPAARKLFGNEVGGMKLAGPGWLLEPDPVALGKYLRQAFENPDATRERGQLASHHAHQKFSWKNSAALAAQRLLELAAARNELASPSPAKTAPLKLPPVALVGQLHETRRLLGLKKLPDAWQATVAAINRRPCHPEAFLLLAEIALAAGNSVAARECAKQACDLAPGWNPARQFLKKPFKGSLKPAWLKLPEKNPTRLSVCLIVKNEEKFLDQCLKSIRGLAHQIVVVDTGSTDRTLEIAKQHGAEIHSMTWCDDFAAARNAALEQATGDWVLTLDADEELPAEQHACLQADLARTAVMAYRLPLVNHQLEAAGPMYLPRLFRNIPGSFYTGRIHEQVFPSIMPLGKSWGLILDFGTAQLLHHGYTKEMVRDRNKIKRNLELLTRAVEENPQDANLMMNFGLELVRSGDLLGGVEKYRAAFKLMSLQKEDAPPPELREVLLTQFTSQLYKIRAHEEIVQALHSPLAKAGGLTASLHFALGLAFFELKQYAAAAAQMHQCINRRDLPTISPINTDILTSAPEHCLALSLAKTGDADGAEKAFLTALNGQKPGAANQEDVKLDYAKFLTAQNRSVDAFHKLHEVVAANSRNLAAWRTGGEIALGRPEFLEFADNWTREALLYVGEDFIVNRQRAEVLLLGGDTKAAAELWERLWNSEHQPASLAALILCEVLESQNRHVPDKIVDEPTTSRAFIKWYQRLIAMRAHAVIKRVNERLEELSRILPTAAAMLEKALAEPQKC